MKVVDLPHPMSIRKALDLYVIGQDQAKMTASVVLRNHLARLLFTQSGQQCVVQEFAKNNLLIIGPSGSGKTHIAETLARITDLPFHAGDATKITQAGYVGGDVEDLLMQLYIKSGFNLKRAQRGIVFIDEIDKIRASGSGLDVNGAAVQRALLTPLNGGKVTLKTAMGPIEFDTTNVLFIGAGAFVGLDAIIERREAGISTMGFGGNPVSHEEDPIKRLHRLLKVTSEDLIEFGLIPEFVGRFPVRTALYPLDQAAMRNILTAPKNSLVDQAQVLLSGSGGIRWEEDGLSEVAREVFRAATGARGLVEVMDEIVRPITYLLPREITTIDAARVRARKDYASEAASAAIPESVEPCRFIWPSEPAQSQAPATTATQAVTTDTTAAAAPARRPHADKLLCRQVWSKGDDDTFMRLLSANKDEKRTVKLYVVGRVFECDCECGHVTRVPVEILLEHKDGIDPLEYLKEERLKFYCQGCSTEQQSGILDFGPSEWTPPKKKN